MIDSVRKYKLDINRSSRRLSSIINLRRFHNWIKRTMIKETVEILKNTYDIKDIALLDLAVGKGGDINKWYYNDIYNVVGIDIDDKSINGYQGAKERYNKLLNKVKKKDMPIPKYNFYVYDLSDPDNINHIDYHLRDKKFNIVSCQFAIHYFFRDEESLDTLLKIISMYIDKHGFFIGTTMDGSKVNQMFMNGNIIDKKLYYLENKTNLEDSVSFYGNRYIASLGEKEGETHYFVDKPSEEYMVDIQELTRMCKKYNLRFIGTTHFEKWYDIYIKHNNKYLSKEEKEFSFLNFSYVFYAN